MFAALRSEEGYRMCSARRCLFLAQEVKGSVVLSTQFLGGSGRVTIVVFERWTRCSNTRLWTSKTMEEAHPVDQNGLVCGVARILPKCPAGHFEIQHFRTPPLVKTSL